MNKQGFSSSPEVDLMEEFASMFTLGSEDENTAPGSQMKFTYMSFGLMVTGIFLFGTLTSMFWRSYKKRGGSFKSLTKTLCQVAMCKCFKKQQHRSMEDAEMEEALLSKDEEDEYDEEEAASKTKKKGTKPMSMYDVEELEGQKSAQDLFLDLQVEGSQQEYDALKKLYSIYAAEGFDEYDMGKLLRSHRFALTNVQGESIVSLDFDEDAYEAKLERYAEAVFPRVVAQLGTWKELTELDVTSRMHPDEEGEHDDFTSDDATTRMLQDPNKCYTWDYCLVFQIGDENKQVKIVTRTPPKDGHAGKTQKTTKVYTEKEYYSRATAHIVGALIYAKLRVALYYSVQRDEIYCLVGASEDRLIKQAEQMELELILNPKKLKERASKMKIPLAHDHGDQISDNVWDNIYGTFKNFKARKDGRHELYQRFDEGAFHPDTVFRTVDRLKLTNAIISDELVLGGASLPLRKFVQEKKHPLLSFYPLDENLEKENLKETAYAIKNFWNPPLEDFRDYFGEQIAMYFGFLSSYTRWLIVPSVVGLGFFMWQCAAGTIDVPGIGAYGVLVAIWASLFLENWRRIEAVLRAKWGMSSADEKENNRPEFDGDWIVSRVTGKLEENHATLKRVKRAIASNMALMLFLCVVLGSIGSIFVIRKALSMAVSFQLSMTLTAICTTVQIQIMNFLYGMISKHLNDFENHQTDTQYFNAMITKSFIFKFINCYNTFLYIGFLKKYDSTIGYCHGSFLYNFRHTPVADQSTVMSFVHGTNTTTIAASGLKLHGLAAVNTLSHGPDYRGDCMYELAHNLAVIFISMILLNNFLEVFVPWVHGYLAHRRETKQEAGHDKPVLSAAELQALNDPYESTFGDYEELAVQFGYVVLFVVAFPATPILALANNIVEYRVDITKLVELTRRPVPRSAGDIGTWYTVLSIVSWLALVTNLGLVMFASNLTKGKSAAFVLIGFIVAEHILFGIKTLIAYLYRGEPAHVKEHHARQKFLSSALIGR